MVQVLRSASVSLLSPISRFTQVFTTFIAIVFVSFFNAFVTFILKAVQVLPSSIPFTLILAIALTIRAFLNFIQQ